MTVTQNVSATPISNDTVTSLIREPLALEGHLEKYKSFNVTPVIGTEFPDANVAEWIKAPNCDELLRDLAITSKRKHWSNLLKMARY